MVSVLEARYRSDCGPLVVGGVMMLAAGFASDFHLGGRRQCRRPPRAMPSRPQSNAVAPPPQGIAIA